MKFDLRETAKDHRIVVAHRGVAGGNIPCNTITAYETALKQGADMIEIDVDCTADGKLVIFHPGMEYCHLGIEGRIPEMTWEEVKALRYLNYDRAPTHFGIETVEDVFERFKGRCYINVDKFWGNPEKIYEEIKRHGITDQVLVKSAVNDQVLDVLEQVAPELPFIPVVQGSHPHHEALMKRNINYMGVEVVYAKEDNYMGTHEFVENMHKDGKLVWVNSIIYASSVQLSGGHSDDSALSDSLDYGWGWLADRDYDFIQTDWAGMLIDYLKKIGKYYR